MNRAERVLLVETVTMVVREFVEPLTDEIVREVLARVEPIVRAGAEREVAAALLRGKERQ